MEGNHLPTRAQDQRSNRTGTEIFLKGAQHTNCLEFLLQVSKNKETLICVLYKLEKKVFRVKEHYYFYLQSLWEGGDTSQNNGFPTKTHQLTTTRAEKLFFLI